MPQEIRKLPENLLALQAETRGLCCWRFSNDARAAARASERKGRRQRIRPRRRRSWKQRLFHRAPLLMSNERLQVGSGLALTCLSSLYPRRACRKANADHSSMWPRPGERRCALRSPVERHAYSEAGLPAPALLTPLAEMVYPMRLSRGIATV